MKAGFYQFRPVFGKIEQNLTRIVKNLSNISADLIVLPELPYTGYYFKDREEVRSLSEELSSSKIIDTLSRMCKKNNYNLVTGFAEKYKDRYFNSAVLIGPEGVIHTYRKLHLFNHEKNWFDAGDIELSVQSVRGVTIGMMVCFDWIFPEVTRCLALQKADIICHPSNLVLDYCQQAMITRSLENSVFTITANRFGADERSRGTLNFTGKSQICSPRGEVIYRAKSDEEILYITEIDPGAARDKLITENNHLLSDRRPEFYTDISG